jgi:hypothetical protein
MVLASFPASIFAQISANRLNARFPNGAVTTGKQLFGGGFRRGGEQDKQAAVNAVAMPRTPINQTNDTFLRKGGRLSQSSQPVRTKGECSCSHLASPLLFDRV